MPVFSIITSLVTVCWWLGRYIYRLFLHTDPQIIWTHVAKRDIDFTVSIFISIDIKEVIAYMNKYNRRNIISCYVP